MAVVQQNLPINRENQVLLQRRKYKYAIIYSLYTDIKINNISSVFQDIFGNLSKWLVKKENITVRHFLDQNSTNWGILIMHECKVYFYLTKTKILWPPLFNLLHYQQVIIFLLYNNLMV